MNLRKLSSLKVDEKGIIIKIDGDSKFKRRLFDMGLTPSTEVILKKRAPFNDPILIKIRGYELTLRKKEADNIVLGEL